MFTLGLFLMFLARLPKRTVDRVSVWLKLSEQGNGERCIEPGTDNQKEVKRGAQAHVHRVRWVLRGERGRRKSWSTLWVRQVVWKNFVHRGTHTRKMVIYFNKIISRANSCHARPLPLPLLSPRTGLEPNQDSHVL